LAAEWGEAITGDKLKVVSHLEDKGLCVVRRGSGPKFLAKCEIVKRSANANEGQQKYENQTQQKGETFMDTNLEICSYADGNLTGGAAVDSAARAHMDETGEKNYAKAVEAVIAHARESVAGDVKEYKNRVRSYQSHFKITEAEARKRVSAHDPRMKALESDPMGPIIVPGIQAPPSKADITVPAWTPPIHEPIAIIQIANLVFGLPKDEFMYITVDQANEAARPYREVLDRARGDKMDYYARTGISVLGLHGFSSENYAAGFRWAVQKYPDLAAGYATGRMTAQAWRELLPQMLIND